MSQNATNVAIVDFCNICHISSRKGSVLEILPITAALRKTFQIVPLPEIYTHYFYGHAESIYDMYVYFFTAEQVKKLPEHICDNCFTEIFSGQAVFRWPYFSAYEGFSTEIIDSSKCGNCQVSWHKLPKENQLYYIQVITAKIRQAHNIPAEFSHFIQEHILLNYRINPQKMSGEKFFLLPDKLNDRGLICNNCLKEIFLDKKMTVIDFDKMKYCEFRVR